MSTTIEARRTEAKSAAKRYPIYLAGEWVESDHPLEVTNPYDGSVIGTTFQATTEQLDQAIVAAEEAFKITRTMPIYDRVAILEAIAAGVKERQTEISEMISREAGKPIREANVETARGIFTLEVAAEEAKRISGEVIPLDLMASSKGRFGIVRRFPIGPIAAISPFIFPLNLALDFV